jgi:Flp pilus assembly protein TadD
MEKWVERIPMVFGMVGCVLGTAWGVSTDESEVAAALQAIQQAPDPSAAVAAYANGVAVDRNDPKLSEAYVLRMVDLGLPELAFHQAQTLTTLESNNGLAWGVIAYVEARRGNMAEAISAINLAGQFAPDNPLVQRTAGEILAWYDVKADKATLSKSAQDGLATIRGLLEKRPEFANAYKTAKNAYGAKANAPEQAQPEEQAQPQAQSTGLQTVSPTATVSSYPDYFYDSGPGWVEPVPWWWWQPVGFFAGFNFVPFSTVIVFNHRKFFRDHDHHFDRDFDRDRNGRFFNGSEFDAHHNSAGGGKFFGMNATPNPSVAASRREGFHQASLTAERTSPRTSVGLTARRMSGRFAARRDNTIVQRHVTIGASMRARSPLSSGRQAMIVSRPQFSSRPQVNSGTRSFAPASRFAGSGMIAPRVSGISAARVSGMSAARVSGMSAARVSGMSAGRFSGGGHR